MDNRIYEVRKHYEITVANRAAARFLIADAADEGYNFGMRPALGTQFIVFDQDA